jgi:hypothetical protein
MMKDLYKLKRSLWHFNNINVYWKRITDNTSSILNVTSNIDKSWLLINHDYWWDMIIDETRLLMKHVISET